MTGGRTEAEWEYELVSEYGKFVVLYVGLLSVLYKRLHGGRQGEPEPEHPLVTDRTQFLAAINGLSEHFVRHGLKPHQIRVTSDATQKLLSKFLVETHDQFAAVLGEKMPEPLQRLRTSLSVEESLSKQLAGLKIGRIEFPRGKDADLVRPFLRLAKLCLGERENHPVLHGINAADVSTLAAECLGIVEADGEAAWKKTGLFCVVREARGPYTSEVRDINIIVRDLLWLRRCTGTDPSGHVPEEKTGPGGNLGFYFSAFDRAVYEIRNLVIRNGTIMIDAISFMETGSERSLCLYYPESTHDHPLHCREGVLMGTTRDPARSGAWKVLIIRPDWSNRAVLDAQLSVYLKQMANMNEQTYRDAVAKCFRFVAEALLVGVLYSRDWARQEPDPRLDKTRFQFRKMLWEQRAKARRDQILLGTRIDAQLGDVLRPVLEAKLAGGKDVIQQTIDAIRTVLTENWSLIEPPQLVSSGYSPDATTPDASAVSSLQNLVRREPLIDYDDYAEDWKAWYGISPAALAATSR